jgi:putative SOS response-associated peptidase YedK
VIPGKTPNESSRRIHACAVVITKEFVGEMHDRMPVLLQPHQFKPISNKRRW